MNSPEKILCRPVFAQIYQKAVSKKIGEFDAPLTTLLDLDDLFGGRSNCILDYLSCCNNNDVQVPSHIIYALKKGVISTGIG